MPPILLIHGYSAESKGTAKSDIAGIYGALPRSLRNRFGAKSVVELDLSRYLSLDDGLTIDDVSRALDHCLREEYPDLLKKPFNVIIHSTGALVVRNWIRLFSKKPSPIRTIIYLAGANFGSGWAHVGRGQLAKWGRAVFHNGEERGLRILNALELGSDETVDLHLSFTKRGQLMAGDYEINECVIVGSQADVSWFPIPIRYAKEDGSDGVVRVSAANLNFNYLQFAANDEALQYTWKQANTELKKHMLRRGDRRAFYELKGASRPGIASRPIVPLAIPFACAHSGEDMGIVVGSGPQEQVVGLIEAALGTQPGRWDTLVEQFQRVTDETYQRVLTEQKPGWFRKWIAEPRAQYDKHAQLVFRIRDQLRRPVENYDIFFDSVEGRKDPSLPMGQLFEDKHRNEISPHIITFYLRTDAFNAEQNEWIPRVPAVDGCYLEVTAVQPETREILYLPMRFEFSKEDLIQWIQPHCTTIIDIELLRLPSPEVFRITSFD